jgi:exodeoxyribonuclease VII large subunit
MESTDTTTISSRQHVYDVSELNRNIKRLLEDKFPFIWISGEISNYRQPSSGHCYFTLKDQQSQLSAVIFRGQAAGLKFRPENGLSVIGLGRISVYEPRGTYQVIFEYLEPKGIGGLQIAFEKLKRQLSDEGLFDDRYKRQLSGLPSKISIVTSPTGAAIRDFINVAQRRFPNLALEVVPVRVQGDQAAEDIVHAIRMLDRRNATDIIVLARGGGSIEDLAAFNDEQVARTIFECRIPIVSAIGHETDFTIADFVADLRAPTPSAAAELIVPDKRALKMQLDEIKQKLYQCITNKLKLNRNTYMGYKERIVHPKRRLQDWRIRLDDYAMRLLAMAHDILNRKKEQVAFRHDMLMQVSPNKSLTVLSAQAAGLEQGLISGIMRLIQDRRTGISKSDSMLDALNPMAILDRGYSITRKLPEKTIVRSTRQVRIDQNLEVLLARGQITVTVKRKR